MMLPGRRRGEVDGMGVCARERGGGLMAREGTKALSVLDN